MVVRHQTVRWSEVRGSPLLLLTTRPVSTISQTDNGEWRTVGRWTPPPPLSCRNHHRTLPHTSHFTISY
jgi:hypothetical protein